MGDLRTSILLNLSGNLQARARQFTNGLDRLGRRGSASMRLLGRGVAVAGRGLDRLGNRYTALITGAAGIGAIRQVGNLEERLTRLGIQADVGEEKIDGLKKRIFEVAKAPDIRVNPGQILSAVEEIIEKTGDLKFAEENIRNIGLAISATGAEGLSIGGILAEFQKMEMGAKDAFEALDILTVQGKQGAFTLQNLAALGPRVVTAYTAMGRGGVTAIREMGAVLQVIRQGTGSSEQAATSFEALMRVLGDKKKIELLQSGGIKVFDPEALKEGRKVLRPINVLMKELVERTKGDRSVIQQVLGDSEAVRAFNAAISEFLRIGGVESLDRFYGVQADGTTITKDSIRAAKTFNAALRGLYTVWHKFSDDQLTEPVKKLTEYLDGLKPGTVERWLELGKNIALIGGGAIVAGKVVKGGIAFAKGGRAVLDMFRKGKKGGVAGGLAGAFGDAIPVYVVNGPASVWNADGPGGLGKKAPKSKSWAGWLAAAAGRGAIALTPAAGAAAMAAGSQYAGEKIGAHQLRTVSRQTLQEMLGHESVTGLGPGSSLARQIRDEIDRRDVADLKRQFSGELKISIESEKPVKVDQLKSSHGFDIDFDSGRMMVAH